MNLTSKTIITYAAMAVLALIAFIILAAALVLWRFNQGLPDYSKLATYEPPIMTRVYAGDGNLIAEYARERRLYVPYNVVPKRVVNAFLSAEDKHFFRHGGVDLSGIVRAMIENVGNAMSNRRLVGASTITQQVARNFLLTSDRTFERKFKEALLAMRLEKAYSKEKILELYLNEIFLGMGSYGVAAAAQNYFGKSLDQLSLADVAYLAALPKGPMNYQPYIHTERAIGRRNWVLTRMEEDGFISEEEAEAAKKQDLGVKQRAVGVQLADAQYFVEEVRRELYSKYGEKSLYEGGLSVRTTIDTRLQKIARDALRKNLVEYDLRHGWRGAVGKLAAGQTWPEALKSLRAWHDLAPWDVAVVRKVTPQSATIELPPARHLNGTFEEKGALSTIPFDAMKWARQSIKNIYLGPELKGVGDALAVGDIVYVLPVYKEGGKAVGKPSHYALRQVPIVNGAVVALDPHTGRVLAMQGGFSFETSEFNRAAQAQRQPGSSFKPFVYAAALDHGFTPSTLVLDAPFVMDQGAGLGLWRPENYDREFRGPSTLRYGIEHSRNVMTVRLAQSVGMPAIVEYAKRFGIADNMIPVLSMSLGAGETTLLKLTAAYAVLDNGGRRVIPTLIDRVQDRQGRTVYKHDARECTACNADWSNQVPPELPITGEQIASAQTAYQMTTMLEGVIQRGTGQVVKSVGVPLAGKTGTSNEERDAWFVGFSPDLVVGVFVGYDTPTPLGRAETGGRTAAPVFRDIMQKELGGKPAIPFRIPPGINLVRVDPRTGQLADPTNPNAILEAFKEGTEPQYASNTEVQSVVGGGIPQSGGDGNVDAVPAGSGTIDSGTGGLY
jgi:penicillin-binding protein 1A